VALFVLPSEAEDGGVNLPTTDFRSHHIEGYARAAQEKGERGHFSVPLVSHVHGNLWHGGCIDGVRLTDDFKFVVSLYPWERYVLGPDTVRVEHRLYDSADIPSTGELYEIAEDVNRKLLVGKTLVHCQAGLNRSGLIVALALILDGAEPLDAIRLLREKRCDMVLCNATFERWLIAQTEQAA
jgi:hypothetical protein